jgi:hypothetical protein
MPTLLVFDKVAGIAGGSAVYIGSFESEETVPHQSVNLDHYNFKK